MKTESSPLCRCDRQTPADGSAMDNLAAVLITSTEIAAHARQEAQDNMLQTMLDAWVAIGARLKDLCPRQPASETAGESSVLPNHDPVVQVPQFDPQQAQKLRDELTAMHEGLKQQLVQELEGRGPEMKNIEEQTKRFEAAKVAAEAALKTLEDQRATHKLEVEAFAKERQEWTRLNNEEVARLGDKEKVLDLALQRARGKEAAADKLLAEIVQDGPAILAQAVDFRANRSD